MKINRMVAFILAICMMTLSFTVVASASENGIMITAENDNSSKNKGLVYSCVYDSESQKIVINGSVTHDIFIAHRDYTVNLYKISPEHSLKTVLEESDVTLLASTSISIKFNFTAEVRELEDIFSQYVVTLVSKSGKVDYVGERFYPFVESEYISETDRTNYKGVRIFDSQEILQAEPSVAIVPIYFDKLISSGTTGYLYSLEGVHTFFDKEYVDSIDQTVRSLYSSGSKVYLQLLLSSKDEASTTLYDLPDMFSVAVVKEIYSYCDFLTSRYSSYKNGFVDGVIIGKKLDDTQIYNNNDYGSEEKYTQVLALYGVVVGVATRKNIPSADLSYSFTNTNTYEDEYKEEQMLGASYIIEKISSYFDGFYSEGFDFSVTLESSHRPLSISNDKLDRPIDTSLNYDGKEITEQNIDVFSDFLDSLKGKYSSVPQNFIYIWTPDRELSGNALACAYTYLYYKLFNEEGLSAFVIGFDDNRNAARDLINIVNYIDTDKGTDNTSQLLRFFGKDSWKSIIDGFNSRDFAIRKHGTIGVPESFSQEMKGEIFYFDFSDSSTHSSWFAGRGFGGISIDYHKVLGRSLCAKLNTDSLSPFEYAYLFNSYEYPENFTYTPYLTLVLAIEDNDDMSDIFEIQIAFENEDSIYEASHIVRTGEITYLHLDISEFSAECTAENMRISVRPMSDTSGDYKLFISSLKGESIELDDDELKAKIDEERLRMRNLLDEDEKSNNQITLITVILAVLAAVILAVTLFFFLRKEDNEDEDGEEKENE